MEKLSLKATYRKLKSIQKYINTLAIEREMETESALISVLTGLSCFYLGDTGAGKSYHVRLICQKLNLSLFDTLISETTKPDHIFGPTDVPALAKGIQRIKTEGYAAASEILFLDEVFKASGVILNPMLTLLNEQIFRNGDDGIIECPIVSVFAASNEIPNDPGLKPIYDRFLIRHEVSYIKSRTNMRKYFNLINGHINVDEPESLTRSEVSLLRKRVQKVEISLDIFEKLLKLRDLLHKALNISISDRRISKCVTALKGHALLNGRLEVESSDLEFMANMMWDDPSQIKKVRSIVLSVAGSASEDVLSYVEESETIYNKAIQTGNISEGIRKIKPMLQALESIKQTSNGRNVYRSVRELYQRLRQTMKDRRILTLIVMTDEKGREWYKVTEASAQLWTADQLRSAGMTFRRSAGYWRLTPPSRSTRIKVVNIISKSLGCAVNFREL